MSVVQRREHLFALHRPLVRELFNDDGVTRETVSTAAKNDASDPRVRLWNSYAMLSGNEDDRKLGNAILRQTPLDGSYDFGMVGALHAWHRLRDAFEPDIKAKFEAAIQSAGRPQMVCDHGFVGMNDNFAAMAVMVAILAGQHNDDEPVIDWAMAKLKEMADRLGHDGAIAEFNSPTYIPITMLCMAEIVNFSRFTHARDLASYIEQQCWLHVCAAYHPGLAIQGGPSSRSYMVDSCGHISNINAMFYATFGQELVPLNPANQGFGQEPRWVVHHDNLYFLSASICWKSLIDYHPPEPCERELRERVYPQGVIARASCAYQWRPDDWQTDSQGKQVKRVRSFTVTKFAPALLTTWHDQDYTLGTASGALACGEGSQEEGFFAAWRRRTPTTDQPLVPEDVCTLFSRFTFDHKRPEPSSGGDMFTEFGYKTAVQDKNAALVLYRPGNQLPKKVTSLGLCLVMPLHCATPGEIWLGEHRFTGQTIESTEPVPVFINDGQVRLFLLPTDITRYHADGPVMRVSKAGNFLTIDLINYEGPQRQLNFHSHAMPSTCNGFACEIASCDDDVDFAAFRQRMAKASLTDKWKHTQRHVHYKRGEVDLLIHHEPINFGVIPEAWIQGKPRQTPPYHWESKSPLTEVTKDSQ